MYLSQVDFTIYALDYLNLFFTFSKEIYGGDYA